MVRNKIFAVTSIIFVLISSCSNVATSTSIIESTATIRIPASTPTNTPTLVPTEIISTVTPSPLDRILKFQPFEINAELSSDAKPTDSLVLCNDSSISLLRFVPDIKVETIVDNVRNILCLPTSPDGKWIAYEQESKDSPTGYWLGIVSADGQQQKKMPEDQSWMSFYDYAWLDNQHLIYNDFKRPVQRNPAYAVVVINPFTGERIKLASDYPGVQLGINGQALAFEYSDVVYDPTLNLVIFPSWGGEHNYIVLWDRRTQTVIAKVEYKSGGFGRYPLWSPDATQFAVAVVNEQRVESASAIDEWYRVSREGRVEQLTHFGKYFSSSEISSGSNWSPDGKKLAFWVDLSPSPCPGLSLAILDIITKQVTDTCLLSTWHSYWTPFWSLDSRYIIILDANSTPVKTILVDTENNQAFDITSLVGDSHPVGWAVSP